MKIIVDWEIGLGLIESNEVRRWIEETKWYKYLDNGVWEDDGWVFQNDG